MVTILNCWNLGMFYLGMFRELKVGGCGRSPVSKEENGAAG